MTTSDFSLLPLSDSMLHNLKELGMAQMTPIQAQSLPQILQGRDVIAQAKTGSGKTAAFGLGVLHQLNGKRFRVQSLILCPTRELADQVAKELRRLARMSDNTKILALTGGLPFGAQLDSLRHGVHVVVATPGRVLKHLQKGSLKLNELKSLVLDEADRMLDMGFIEEIEEVISYAPKQRQTLLFSATYPAEIEQLSDAVQSNALQVETHSSEVANPIEEHFYEAQPQQEKAALLQILAHYRPEHAMVFTNTKLEAKELAKTLLKQGVDALAIHGDLDQIERTDVLVQFANQSCSILVATDVAARGLDIKSLEMVINYGLPQDDATYTHRIGRTGRAGERGVAVTLISGRETLAAEAYQNGVRSFELVSRLPAVEQFSLQAKNRTLVIGGGKKDKVRPGDLLGALTGDAGIDGKAVGKIDLYDRQSYVAIARNRAEKARDRLKRGKIKGRKFTVGLLR
ncbi:MAG: ATP-dependent RNA helicase DbpA [Gammaproteobacteria bacterium]|jgi:ATP-independent RNA helicase DbpA|nr:ATP-dependent RNA helicase DbpA [Gammaproteobacteria bacterium]